MLVLEGFDKLSTAYLAMKGWNKSASNANVNSSYARFTGNGLGILSGTSWISKAFTPDAEIICGFAFQAVSPGSDNISICALRYGANIQAYLAYSRASQKFTIYNHSDAAIQSTATDSVRLDTWYYVEFKVVVGDSGTGAVYLDINGVNLISETTGVDTKNGTDTTIDNVIFGSRNAGGNNGFSTFYIDDVYVFDTNGSTNNAALGEVMIQTIVPTSDETITWDRSTGSVSYELVDDAAPDGDSTYVYTATAAEDELYGFGNLLANTASVYGLQVNACARKDDSGARTLNILTKSGTTTDPGDTESLDISYTFYQDIHETDPDTATAWTPSGVDAMQAGLRSG